MTSPEEIERYATVVLNVRAILALPDLAVSASAFGAKIVARAEAFLADHMDDVAEACLEMQDRQDDEGRAALAYLQALLASYGQAGQAVAAMLDRLKPGRAGGA